MSRRRSLSEEEHALWRGVARSIKPLQPSRPSVEPPAASRPPARHDALPAKKAPPLAPLGRRLKGRVARGREPIDDRLDLHGFTQGQAHAALLRFLRGAQVDGAKIVLVVTGKGNTRGQRDAAACSSAWCRSGWRYRNSAPLSSVSRTRMSDTAGRAPFTSASAARASSGINLTGWNSTVRARHGQIRLRQRRP